MNLCRQCGSPTYRFKDSESCPACLLGVSGSPDEGSKGTSQTKDLETALRFRDSFPDERYRILGILGEGGMGEIYAAEQIDPIQRKVAIKVIKAGMDTREVVKRFESERQVLTLMEHPGIARVFDAGETGNGRPYFAMELVSGVPLVEFCQEENLDLGERLDLFLGVCSAVLHAHQKGIIHRDLKPSNLLVSKGDREPWNLKVIDFGIAKAIGEDALDRTLITRHDRVLGTPEYMSPEQARGSIVDTRADIYALGCILYELLTGTTPINGKETGDLSLNDKIQRIREEEPERPSVRIARTCGLGTGEESPSASGTAQWRRKVPGDLDWITLKALEKDPDRRYSSVGELSQDLSNYLKDRPVSAQPPSQLYLFRKFAKRNRLLLGAASSILLVMVLATILSVRWAMEANESSELARARLAQADAVPQFLLNAFRLPDPEVGGTDLMAVDVLDRALVEAKAEFPDQPLILARVLESIGETYKGLGWYQKAATTYIEVDRVIEGLPGGDEIRRRLHQAQSETFRLLDAREEAVRASEAHLRETTQQFGEHSQEAKRGRYELVLNLIQSGEIDRAQEIVSEVRSRENPEDLEEVSDFADLQALIHDAEGRFEEALSYYEKRLQPRLAGKRRYDHDEMWTLRHLVRISLKAGELEEAVAYAEELFRCCEFAYGKGHRYVVDATVLLSRAYLSAGDRNVAALGVAMLDQQAVERGISSNDQSLLRRFREASGLESKEGAFSEMAPDELPHDHAWWIAEFQYSGGNHSEALKTMVRLLPRGKVGSEDDLKQFGRLSRLAIGLMENGSYGEAASYLLEAVESPARSHVLAKVIPSVSNQFLEFVCTSGALDGDPDLAEKIFELAGLQPDRKNGRMYDAYAAIRRDYLDREGDRELVSFEETMVQRFAEFLPPGHHALMQRQLLLGEILVNRKRPDEGLTVLKEIIRNLPEGDTGKGNLPIASYYHLARAYRGLGETGKAKEALRKARDAVQDVDPEWWEKTSEVWNKRFADELRALEGR